MRETTFVGVQLLRDLASGERPHPESSEEFKDVPFSATLVVGNVLLCHARNRREPGACMASLAYESRSSYTRRMKWLRDLADRVRRRPQEPEQTPEQEYEEERKPEFSEEHDRQVEAEKERYQDV